MRWFIRRLIRKLCKRSAVDWDPYLSAKAAHQFLELATIYADRLHKYDDITAANRFAQAHPGETIASAVNMAFAVELRLKLVLRVLDRPVPREHNARKLFKKLPADIRNDIRRRWDEWERTRNRAVVESVDIIIRSNRTRHTKEWSGGDNNPQAQQQQKKKKKLAKTITTLGDHLKRNSNAFVAWRYVFADVEEDGNHRRLFYDFVGQAQLCHILRHVASEVWRDSRGNIEDIDPPPPERRLCRWLRRVVAALDR